MTTSYVVTVDGDGAHSLTVRRDGAEIELPEATRRLLLAIVDGPRRLDELIDAVWGGTPPNSAAASLHNRLSKLRRLAPDLITRRSDHYALGAGVVVEHDVVTVAPETDRIVAARRRVDDDPFDERASATLVAELASIGDHDGARAELRRVRAELAEVGLEPGRRLTDLARMIDDGERRIERLAGLDSDTRDVGLVLGSFAMDGIVEQLREWLIDGGDGLLVISGPTGSGRSHALRLARDLAIGMGLESATVHARTHSVLPVLPVGTPHHGSLQFVEIDDVDRTNAATERMVRRLVERRDGPLPKIAITVESAEATIVDELSAVTTAAPTHARLEQWTPEQRRALLERLSLPADQHERIASHLDALDGPSNRSTLDAIRLASGDAADRAAFDRLTAASSVIGSSAEALDVAFVTAMLQGLDHGARQVVDLLAMPGSPVLIDDLGIILPDARQQLRRREVFRLLDIDEVTRRVRTRDSVVDRVVLDHVSPRRRVELNTTLATAAYDHEATAVRARRHAAHGAEAHLSPLEAARSVASLADAVSASGDRLTAADISQLAADAVVMTDPGRFCELSIRAGSELLTAGDPVGLQSIETAIEVALANGLLDHASRGTWAYCGLGPTSGAGQIDQSAAAMIDRVEPLVTADADLAHILIARSMVFTLTGDSRRCADAFDRAVEHARATGDDLLLCNTLPSAYMSLAAPDHLSRREAFAAELHELATTTGRLATEWEALHLDFSNQLQRGDPSLRATLDALRDVTARLDGAQHDWELTYLSSVVAQIDGDLDTSLRLAEESLGAGGAVGESRRSAIFGAIVLGHHLATDSVGELAPLLEQMIAEQPLLAAWRAPYALAAAQLGDHDTALEHLRWLAEPDAIEPDCTMTAVATVAGDAISVVAGSTGRSREPGDDEIGALLHVFERELAPWSGRWSWYGAGTYGPVDTTLARIHRQLGDDARSVELAAAATAQAARLRAPHHSRVAAALLI